MSARLGAAFAPPALLVLLHLLSPPRALAQGCCAPGSSPLGGLSGALPAAGKIDTGAWLESSALEQAYAGSRRVEEVNDRSEQVTRAAAYARVGLPGGAAFLVEWPYEWRRRDQTIRTESQALEFDLSNRAPGDLSTLLLVQLLPRRGVSPWGLEGGIGMKWANGSVDRSDAGRFLPVELQSGTGSTDPLFSLSARRIWPRLSIQAAAVYRIGTTGRNHYRFGSEWNDVTSVNWAVTSSLSIGGDLRVRMAGQDRIAGRIPPNTGGERLLAGPRITGTFRRLRVRLHAAWFAPVYQNLNGRQLGLTRQIVAGLAWPAD